MPLEATLSDIIAQLKQGNYANEQAVSQGIVLRLLQELGWDTWNTASVWPEYQTGEGRADFALCSPPRNPALFIEVKQPGRAEESVRQALEYAFHTGVQFIVLTDGKTWSFYLPAEPGSYEDRRVYQLDLFERTPAEAAGILLRYLARKRVESGEMLETARSEYRNRNRQAQARNALPAAWDELIERGDDSIVELLTKTVESKTGVRPVVEDVMAFLERLTSSGATVPAALPGHGAVSLEPRIEIRRTFSRGDVPASRAGVLVLFGVQHPYSNAKEGMLAVLQELARRDSTFLQRFAQRPDNQRRSRRWIARSPQELYPERPDLAQELYDTLPDGWFIGTNISNAQKNDIMRVAAEVANIVLGKDLIVDF